jgi:hypothetical protein
VSAAATREVCVDVLLERERQEKLGLAKRDAGTDWRSCADPTMRGGDPMRLTVLVEEVGEVARAVLEGDTASLRAELVQVAAVAVAWIEALDVTP